MILKRSLEKQLKKYLKEKILLISGPRQVGKTTLSKTLGKTYEYFNYDNQEDRETLKNKEWVKEKGYLIFDEVHKKDSWKRWLKGIYDTQESFLGLVVTGSVRMDTYRKVGDSLAGRFFSFRLHPLDLKEIYLYDKKVNPEKTLNQLLKFGGFPEPYLKKTLPFYKQWKRSHLESILRHDLIELETPRNLKKIEHLIGLLKKSIGHPLSCLNLSRQLECNVKSVELWLEWLENLFVIFKVPPYHKNITHALKKKSKYYFYDIAQVPNDEGKRLENLVASSLLKENHFKEDCYGEERGLFFIQNKDKKKIDFLVVKDETPLSMIEVKLSQNTLDPNFKIFSSYFEGVSKFQIVKNLKREKDFFKPKVKLRKASSFLKEITL